MRFISKKDCGSFLYDSCRVAYLTGCKFPLPASDLLYSDFTMTSKIVSLFNQTGLMLQIWFKKSPAAPLFDLFFGCSEHKEFLKLLEEASTLYLLEGPPFQVSAHNRSLFINRLSGAGQGIVITHSVRESISDLIHVRCNSQSFIVV